MHDDAGRRIRLFDPKSSIRWPEEDARYDALRQRLGARFPSTLFIGVFVGALIAGRFVVDSILGLGGVGGRWGGALRELAAAVLAFLCTCLIRTIYLRSRRVTHRMASDCLAFRVCPSCGESLDAVGEGLVECRRCAAAWNRDRVGALPEPEDNAEPGAVDRAAGAADPTRWTIDARGRRVPLLEWDGHAPGRTAWTTEDRRAFRRARIGSVLGGDLPAGVIFVISVLAGALLVGLNRAGVVGVWAAAGAWIALVAAVVCGVIISRSAPEAFRAKLVERGLCGTCASPLRDGARDGGVVSCPVCGSAWNELEIRRRPQHSPAAAESPPTPT